MDLDRIRTVVRAISPYLMVFLFLWLIFAASDLVTKGVSLFSLSIAVMIVAGFLLTFSPKYSYYGSLLAAIEIVFLFSMYITQVYLEVGFFFQCLVSFTVSVSSVLSLHLITKNRALLPQFINSTFFLTLAYIFTTLYAIYMEGTTAETSPWIVFSSFMLVILALIIPVNFGFRQFKIRQIIDISDFNVYHKTAENLMTVLGSRSYSRKKLDSEIGKIVSELKSAVNSFLCEYYEGSIIHSYNVNEGLGRLVKNWLNTEDSQRGQKILQSLDDESKALDDWRQDIAHSNVIRPDRKKKVRKEKKKLENPYIGKFKKDYERALMSINFAVKTIDHLCERLP